MLLIEVDTRFDIPAQKSNDTRTRHRWIISAFTTPRTAYPLPAGISLMLPLQIPSYMREKRRGGSSLYWMQIYLRSHIFDTELILHSFSAHAEAALNIDALLFEMPPPRRRRLSRWYQAAAYFLLRWRWRQIKFYSLYNIESSFLRSYRPPFRRAPASMAPAAAYLQAAPLRLSLVILDIFSAAKIAWEKIWIRHARKYNISFIWFFSCWLPDI